MDELVFLVQGSAPEPYEVTFFRDGGNLTAICTCPAGEHGSFCKHRIGILDGEPKGLVSDNGDDVATVARWLAGTDVEAALLEVREAEQVAAEATKRLKAAKKKLARMMNS